MRTEDCIGALELPADALVHQRVSKKLLTENGAPTATDKRYINEGIEDLHWVAALKPTTIGVSEYRDAVREYLEIAVLTLNLRANAKVNRLIELVHRAIPYPALLVTEHGGHILLSAAHVRWSQAESGKTVLDGEVVAARVPGESTEVDWKAFSLAGQPRTSLYALYQGWLDLLLALQAARLTGTFLPGVDGQHSRARREVLQECTRLEMEIAKLRAAAIKEKQVSRRVELNLKVKELEAAHAAARERL